MAEGNVFIVSWERMVGGYRLWVRVQPTLAAEGTSFEEADKRLTQMIGLATGDGENIHEFVPSRPLFGSTTLERGRLWGLGVEPSADMRDPAGLFEGGLCESCFMPRGPRTDVPLAVGRVQSRVQASTVSLPRCAPGVGPVLSISTEELLALLTPVESGEFNWRPVATLKGENR